MNRSLEVEIKVGIFVALGSALVFLVILMLGGGRSIFSRDISFHARIGQVEGVVEGAPVKIAGVRVGQVDQIKFEPETNQIDIGFSIRNNYHEAVREDSTVSIQTQGVLGDRYLVVSMGNPKLPIAEPGALLKSQAPKDLRDYLNNADEVLARLKSALTHIEEIAASFSRESRSEIFFRNLTGISSNVNSATHVLPAKIQDFYASMTSMKSIMSKIDHGDGTLGALINDPSLYDDLKALLGGANRNKVLKYFVRKSVEDSREEAAKAEKK